MVKKIKIENEEESKSQDISYHGLATKFAWAKDHDPDSSSFDNRSKINVEKVDPDDQSSSSSPESDESSSSDSMSGKEDKQNLKYNSWVYSRFN